MTDASGVIWCSLPSEFVVCDGIPACAGMTLLRGEGSESRALQGPNPSNRRWRSKPAEQDAAQKLGTNLQGLNNWISQIVILKKENLCIILNTYKLLCFMSS
ncbi:MAG: hypothetical protein D4R64_18180 [Porphyromonadaceae bacterium]|nr:MAG: hypothetical protein D4R64_18180 [Porphyromonadaceae bacterium]